MIEKLPQLFIAIAMVVVIGKLWWDLLLGPFLRNMKHDERPRR